MISISYITEESERNEQHTQLNISIPVELLITPDGEYLSGSSNGTWPIHSVRQCKPWIHICAFESTGIMQVDSLVYYSITSLL